MIPENMNAGVQPLDTLMETRGLKNHDLVAAAPELFLTHKEVAKARKGRRLTSHSQRRILTALNAALNTRELPPAVMADVFDHRGR